MVLYGGFDGGMMNKNIIKVSLFLIIFTIMLDIITRIIIPEDFAVDYFETFPNTNTNTYYGFYQMRKDSVDVIFAGSSCATSAFIPQELYNNYGIISYNIGGEQQNLISTYFWLKEVLQTQSPEVIVLESKFLFEDYDEISEVGFRKSMDNMKMSYVKTQAIKEICEFDVSQTEISYYLPIIRFHERWKNLYNDSISYYLKMRERYELKGFCPLIVKEDMSKYEYIPVNRNFSMEYEQIDEIPKKYMDRIVTLCKENDIKLILTLIPTWFTSSVEKNNTLHLYAEQNDLLCIDFNEENIQSEIMYQYLNDNRDHDHASFSGAIKITNYIGEILKNNYGIGSKYDEQWESTKLFYQNLKMTLI